MALKIILTDSALADFERLMEWSVENHPAGTERFGTALLNHIELLRQYPALGEPIKGFSRARRLLHSPFYIYYRVHEEKEKIEVLRFWHVSRRQPKF